MITIKLPYKATEKFQILLKIIRQQQSCAIHSAYNRFKENKTLKEVNYYIKNLNGINKLNSWMLYSATNKASQYPRNKTVIFGGKQNLIDYNKKKITKEEFKDKRLNNFISVGESNQNGNRLFKLDTDNNKMIFKFEHKNHFKLILPKIRKNYLEKLKYLQHQCELKLQPFTVELNDEFIFISFESQKQLIKNLIKNRIFSIDMNPNEIGWSILQFDNKDEFKIIDSGIIDNSKLNDDKETTNYNTNKRRYECFQVSKFLVEKSKHYKCEKFVLEDLIVASKNHQKGRKFNRLVNNNWNRRRFVLNLNKWCDIFGIEMIKINPSYSSFVGNVVNGKEFPDPVCSAIELGRRGHKKFVKGWFYPKLVVFKDLPKQWKQEVNPNYESWRELFNNVKNLELKYHFSWKESKDKFQVFSLKSLKSKVEILSRKDAVNI